MGIIERQFSISKNPIDRIARIKELLAQAKLGDGRAEVETILSAMLRDAALAPDSHDLAIAVVSEHENLDDRAPTEPECQQCNLGTGPHKRTCAYHQAKALIAKATGAAT
jgi:hypothetical protein